MSEDEVENRGLQDQRWDKKGLEGGGGVREGGSAWRVSPAFIMQIPLLVSLPSLPPQLLFILMYCVS